MSRPRAQSDLRPLLMEGQGDPVPGGPGDGHGTPVTAARGRAHGAVHAAGIIRDLEGQVLPPWERESLYFPKAVSLFQS